jgi:hypothetical protein
MLMAAKRLDQPEGNLKDDGDEEALDTVDDLLP